MVRKPKRNLTIGEKVNRLKVLSLHHKDERSRKYYLFRCDCGVEKVVHGAAVVSGNTKSCGCLVREIGRSKRISDDHSEVTAIILGYKRHAERRGFEWLLPRDFVRDIIQKQCHYCNSEPSNKKKTKNSLGDGLLYNGIDRVDSSKGYTEDNVVPCCKICNYAKSSMDVNEFRTWAIRLGEQAMANQWGGIA